MKTRADDSHTYPFIHTGDKVPVQHVSAVAPHFCNRMVRQTTVQQQVPHTSGFRASCDESAHIPVVAAKRHQLREFAPNKPALPSGLKFHCRPLVSVAGN